MLEGMLDKVPRKAMKGAMYSAIVATAAALGGCSSDTGFEFTLLEGRVGHQNAWYRENDDRTPTDVEMMKKDAQPYNKSTVTNEAVGSGFMDSYNNRDR